ncbi:Bug family tripartite tricarboxylate transporter substrate binding protein [Cupriavidus sp. CP313]
MSKPQVIRRLCVILALAVPISISMAQPTAPVFKATRPIRLVVPFPPGGGGDIAGRIAAQAVADRFGQPVIVDNKTGAGGAIGSEFAARSAPDGYTLLLASSDTHSIYPNVHPGHKFRASEFKGVTPVAKQAFVLVGRPGLAAKSVAELIALARSRQLSYSSWGPGSSAHLAMAAFAQAAKVPEFLHVPYQGAAPAAQAVISGQVDLAVLPMPLAKAQDKLIRLGVLSAERSRHMPDIPTLREQKVDLVSEIWVGLLAPPGTPSPVVDALAQGFMPALSSPAIQKALDDSGMTAFVLPPAAFQQYLATESAKWAQIAKAAKIQLD